MKLDKREYYNEKYEWISNLLLYFLGDTYYPERSDEDTIRRFVEEVDSEGIKDTIKEVREVLELKPFPWEWVYAVTGYLSLNYIKANTKEEKFKKWVRWMIEALEKEAKAVGKL